jgi:single-stranded DNA-binding protein
MNQIKLSLRAADDPRSIKEEAGLPTFASVFSLHNASNQTKGEVIPITVKASNELATTMVAELKKGVAFVVEGKLAYYKNPDTNREAYSIVADRFIDITPPKSTAGKPREVMGKSTTVSIALDEDAYFVFQNASDIVSKAGIRVPTSQLVQTMINAEISRLSARKIAQRFLKSVMEQVGALAGKNLDEEDDSIPSVSMPDRNETLSE